MSDLQLFAHVYCPPIFSFICLAENQVEYFDFVTDTTLVKQMACWEKAKKNKLHS